MPLDFDALIQDVSPESLKAAMKQGLAESGVSVDTREGSYTDLLYSQAAYQIYRGVGLSPYFIGGRCAQRGVRALSGPLWGYVRSPPHPIGYGLCGADLHRG